MWQYTVKPSCFCTLTHLNLNHLVVTCIIFQQWIVMVLQATDKWCFLANCGIRPENSSLCQSGVHGPMWYYIQYTQGAQQRGRCVWHAHKKYSQQFYSQCYTVESMVLYIFRCCIVSSLTLNLCTAVSTAGWCCVVVLCILQRMYTMCWLCLGLLFYS